MKETIKKVIAEFWDRKIEYISRERISSELLLKKLSLVVIGPRRAGKSYTLYEIKDLLLKAGKKQATFLYVNFEDERLNGFERKHFDLILEAYFEMQKEEPVMLLDEIHNIRGWDQFIRRLADSGYKTIVTGSNSKMLSREIAEKLGGRFPEIAIYPLDFIEFLKFKGIILKPSTLYSKERFEIKKYFDEYLHYGGFPETAFLSDKNNKIRILETYFSLVFYKDLIGRSGLENENALRFTIKKLRESIGNTIAPRAIHAAAINANIEVGPATIEKYLNYLEEAILILPCFPYAKSVLKQERKKRYFVDNGYIKLFEVKEDKGLLLENLIFMELIKKGKKVCYHQSKKECDFIVNGKEAIQVTYELNENNEERETEGLLEAMNLYEITKGTIITNDQSKQIIRKQKKINVVSAWEWCLKQ